MKLNLYPDECAHYVFFRDWIPGKELAVIDFTDYNPDEKISIQYFNATARNRAAYCVRKGYRSLTGWENRNERLDDLFKINTSKDIRQGRRLPDNYFDFPKTTIPGNQCPKHHIDFIGIEDKDGTLVAYCELYIIGEYAHISRILGHYDHLKNGIMLLLMQRIILVCISNKIKGLCYYLWNSGGEGLRYFKHSTGFKPETIQI